jgi:hypothetical protein
MRTLSILLFILLIGCNPEADLYHAKKIAPQLHDRYFLTEDGLTPRYCVTSKPTYYGAILPPGLYPSGSGKPPSGADDEAKKQLLMPLLVWQRRNNG